MPTYPDLSQASYSAEPDRPRTAPPIFSPLTDRIVMVLSVGVGTGLYIWSDLNRTFLLTPVDPNLRAIGIGAGVFVGVLLAAVATDVWKLGIGGPRRRPNGPMALLSLLMLIIACGFSGHMLAERFVEWRAFDGFQPTVAQEVFTVTGRTMGRRASDSIDLQGEAGERATVNCSTRMFRYLQVGDRLVLPVETGRAGVRRSSIPNDLGHLHRA